MDRIAGLLEILNQSNPLIHAISHLIPCKMDISDAAESLTQLIEVNYRNTKLRMNYKSKR